MAGVTTIAKVQVTIEITNVGSWGATCTLDQVFKQAAENAVGYLERLAKGDGRIRVVDQPRVLAVTTPQK